MKKVESIRSTTSMDKAIGSKIRSLRNLRDMSQSELGAALNVSFQQVQKYEKGTNRVTVARLMQIAKALKEDVSYFMDTGDVSQATVDFNAEMASPQAVQLMQAFIKLPRGRKRTMLVSIAEEMGR